MRVTAAMLGARGYAVAGALALASALAGCFVPDPSKITVRDVSASEPVDVPASDVPDVIEPPDAFDVVDAPDVVDVVDVVDVQDAPPDTVAPLMCATFEQRCTLGPDGVRAPRRRLARVQQLQLRVRLR